jgi:hypothetical protein
MGLYERIWFLIIVFSVFRGNANAVLTDSVPSTHDHALSDIQLMLDHLMFEKVNRRERSRYIADYTSMSNLVSVVTEEAATLEQPQLTRKEEFQQSLSEKDQLEFLSVYSTIEAAIQLLEPTSTKSQFRGGGQRHPLLS